MLSEILDRLTEYGLKERQAKMYLYLIQNGPSKLNDIAKGIGLHRMQTYRTLKQLIELGIVEASLTRPTFFSPLPPKEALNLLIQDIIDKVDRLKENMAFTLEALKHFKNFNSFSQAKFKIIQGRKQTFKLIKDMTKRAKVEINNINTKNGLIRCVKSGLDEILEACAKRGVKTRWLAEIDSSNLDEVRRLKEFGEVRSIKIPSTIRLVIVDETETLLSSVYDDSINLTTAGDITFWTNDKNISRIMNYFFFALWNMAK
ncbi:hypothetical protein HRbin06_00423 [archaeon HR06]|nr:hypothetical protein HRbin06_00423 [archaeon HR06]